MFIVGLWFLSRACRMTSHHLHIYVCIGQDSVARAGQSGFHLFNAVLPYKLPYISYSSNNGGVGNAYLIFDPRDSAT
jgi:hypothetical protein